MNENLKGKLFILEKNIDFFTIKKEYLRDINTLINKPNVKYIFCVGQYNSEGVVLTQCVAVYDFEKEHTVLRTVNGEKLWISYGTFFVIPSNMLIEIDIFLPKHNKLVKEILRLHAVEKQTRRSNLATANKKKSNPNERIFTNYLTSSNYGPGSTVEHKTRGVEIKEKPLTQMTQKQKNQSKDKKKRKKEQERRDYLNIKYPVSSGRGNF